MACSKCGGYDVCQCDLIAMREELRVKELECYALRDIIRIKEESLGIKNRRLIFPADCIVKDTCPTVKNCLSYVACSNSIGRCVNQTARDQSYSV